jgi:glutamate 5-kinase
MRYNYKDNGCRQAVLKDVRRVVVKVGTRLLTAVDGVSKGERVEQLIAQIAWLRDRGIEVILVSSGAIGAGMRILNTAKRPVSLPRLQAHAAVGQSRLMYLYETACAKHGFHSGQMLLSTADVQDRERHLNIASCMNALLAADVLPVVNENDSVSVDEIKFGDNDTLAAMVALFSRADLTILLTAVDGLHDLEGGRLGKRISVVDEVTDQVRAMAGDTEDKNTSTGGMISKLAAADTVTRAGEPLWIADGRDFSVLQTMFEGKDVGTVFRALSDTRMRGHKRYLAFFSEPCGELEIDSGAVSALQAERGASLLPKGVVGIRGGFSRGDTVRILAPGGSEVGRGISNFDSDEILKIKGCHTSDIKRILGYDAYDCIVHRDYLAVTQKEH